MINLHSKSNHALGAISHTSSFIAKITTNIDLPKALRANQILIVTNTEQIIPEGFGLVLIAHDIEIISIENALRLAPELRYLKEHDVVKFYPDISKIDVLYRKEANTNSFLVTERCNSFCIMCSQPPRDIDDHYLVDDMLAALPQQFSLWR